MTTPAYRAIPDPVTPGRWIAVWPGGRSSGWHSEATARKYALSMKPAKGNREPLDLRPCKDNES